MMMGSQQSNWEEEIRRYLELLGEVRAEVDSPNKLEHERGVARMNTLPSDAQSLASLDRAHTVGLLGQLRELVAQMS
ncbi:MAG: hypothetical protein ABSC08_04430, partial [Bryobacteraceae bacterium]